MNRVVLWVLGGALIAVAAVGIVGLVLGGNCGCADPNYVCAAQPCPSSDAIWFVFVFVGSFVAPFLFIAAGFMGHNARLRRYQSHQAPVAAETPLPAGPVIFPDPRTMFTGNRTWSTPTVSSPTQASTQPASAAPAAAPASSQPFGGALGGFGVPSSEFSPSPLTPSASGGGESERLRQLAELQKLRESGAITQAEFEQQKGRILSES